MAGLDDGVAMGMAADFGRAPAVEVAPRSPAPRSWV